MPTTPPTERDEDADRHRQASMNDLIGRHVVRSLGSPADLLKVQVRPLGRDRYRVNVLVGKSAGSARIADSFFVTADPDGNILTSSPEIARIY